MKTSVLAMLAMVSISLTATADYMVPPKYDGPDIDIGEFVEPNELHPEVARGLYASGGKGVHISVGSERGYIGFAMNTRATHLLMADIDAQIVKYNTLNIALLQMAKTQKDFLRLRFTANHRDWLNGVSTQGLSEQAQKLLQDPEVFKWWQQRVATSETLKNKNAVLGDNTYLNNPEYFKRVWTAAKEGRIQALRLSLTSEAQLQKLSSELKKKNLRISILDMSSAWMPRYVGNTAVYNLLSNLGSAFDSESGLMLTKGDREYGHWKYVVYKGNYIARDSARSFEGTQIQKMFDNYTQPVLYGFHGARCEKIFGD